MKDCVVMTYRKMDDNREQKEVVMCTDNKDRLIKRQDNLSLSEGIYQAMIWLGDQL